MPKHATTAAESPHIQHLTKTALTTGRAALVKFGPEAAVRAMQPWAERIERARRKQERRHV